MATDKTKAEKEYTVEEKLKTLYDLQTILSEIDRIKTLRGELPLEVQDLEDEIAGLETRIKNFHTEIEDLKAAVSAKKVEIQNAQTLIEKYTKQQDNVRNNREFDFLSKEIEYQTLEIQLCEKRINEFIAAQDSCGGCFNRIPPQRQLDIKMRKKIIVCEYCGRIMIDPELAGVKDVN